MSTNKQSQKKPLSKVVSFIALTGIAAPSIMYGAQPTQDPTIYSGYQPPETNKTVFITPLWMNCGDWGQPANGDYARSMAATDEVIYITDCSDAERPTLWRFDPVSGRRLTDLPVTYTNDITPSGGLINHVGTDNEGLLYVSAEVRNASEPTVNIDIIDPSDGTVTKRISHKLTEILPDKYIQIKSRYIGNPEISGSLAEGTYELVVPETFDFYGGSDPDGTGIRLWRIRYENGMSDDDPRVSKLLLPTNESDGRLDPYIRVDENARVAIIDEKKSIVDDGINPPMYFRVKNLGIRVNSWLKPSGEAVDPKAIGITAFEWDGQRYLIYGSNLDGGTRFSISHWTDTNLGLDGDNIKHVWTIPAITQGMGLQTESIPLTLTRVINDQTRNRVNLYLYSPGNGLAAYSISDRRQSGTTDIANIEDVPKWELSNNRLMLSSPQPLKAVRPDGTIARIYPAAITHNLSDLRHGIYILISESVVIKYTNK